MDANSVSCVDVVVKKRLRVLAYACQVIAIFTVIIACVVNLSLGNDKEALWASLLSGALGCMLPNPKIRKNESSYVLNTAEQQLREILSEQHRNALHDEIADDSNSVGPVGGSFGGNNVH